MPRATRKSTSSEDVAVTAAAGQQTKRVTRGKKSASLQEVDLAEFEEEEEEQDAKTTPAAKGRGKPKARGKSRRGTARGRGKSGATRDESSANDESVEVEPDVKVMNAGGGDTAPTKKRAAPAARRSTRTSKRFKSNDEDISDDVSMTDSKDESTDQDKSVAENDQEKKDEQNDDSVDEDKPKITEETKIDEDDEEKNKLEEEQNKIAEEAKNAEEKKKIAEELMIEEEKKRNEELKIAEEKKKVEELKIAEEKKRNETLKIEEDRKNAELKKVAEEKQKIEEEKLKIAEEKKRNETLKIEEDRKNAELKKVAEEKQKIEEEKLKIAEEKKRTEMLKIEEDRKNTELKKVAEEKHKIEEQKLKLAEEKKRIEMLKIEEDRKNTELKKVAEEKQKIEEQKLKFAEEKKRIEMMRIELDRKKAKLIKDAEEKKKIEEETLKIDEEKNKLEQEKLDEMKFAEQKKKMQEMMNEQEKIKIKIEKVAQLEKMSAEKNNIDGDKSETVSEKNSVNEEIVKEKETISHADKKKDTIVFEDSDIIMEDTSKPKEKVKDNEFVVVEAKDVPSADSKEIKDIQKNIELKKSESVTRKVEDVNGIQTSNITTENGAAKSKTTTKIEDCKIPSIPVVKQTSVKEVVRLPLPNDALFHRNQLVNRSLRFRRDDPDFSIATYNILHETHALNCVKEYGSYHWMTVDNLLMDVRHKRLVLEMCQLDADVLCLQEVSPAYFEQIKTILAKHGYEGVFVKRTHKDYNEGEATFYKTSVFSMVSHEGISLTKLIRAELDISSVDKASRNAIKASVESPAVFLLTCLKHIKAKRIINVANIHVSFENFSRPDLQCIQVASTLRKMKNITGPSERMIIVGDFNSTPVSPVYQMIQDCRLNPLSKAKLSVLASVNLSGKMISLVELWNKAFEHDCQLASAYKVIDNQEPTTAKFPHDNGSRQVDYIWYNNLIPRTVLNCPPQYKVKQGIPNQIFPSDHISLKAEFNFD